MEITAKTRRARPTRAKMAVGAKWRTTLTAQSPPGTAIAAVHSTAPGASWAHAHTSTHDSIQIVHTF